MSRDETNKYLVRLQNQIKSDPLKFENDLRTVKSYIDDMDEIEEKKK